MLIYSTFNEKSRYESYTKLNEVMELYQPIAEFVVHMQKDLISDIIKYKLDLDAPPFPEIDKVSSFSLLCTELIDKTKKLEVDNGQPNIIKGAMIGLLEVTQYYLDKSLVREGAIEDYWGMESYYSKIRSEYEGFFDHWGNDDISGIPETVITKIYGNFYSVSVPRSLPDIPEFEIPDKWKREYSKHVRYTE